MDIVLHNVPQAQLTLIQELAKVLGISYEAQPKDKAENAQQIDAAINRVEAGAADLRQLDWQEFRKLAYGE